MAKKVKQKKVKIKRPGSLASSAALNSKVNGSQAFNPFIKQHLFVCMGLMLFSVLLYIQTTNFGFILDDKLFYSENTHVTSGLKGLGDIFTKESMSGYYGEQKVIVPGARYRPLSLATFALEHQLWKLKPGMSHFINLLLYGLTGLLIYYLCSLFWPADRSRKWYLQVGFWAAILFIAHPVHTEVVANVKGRDEIMALLFSLLALTSAFNAKKTLDYLWVGVLFYLALLSKENAITFLFVIPASLYFFHEKIKKEDYVKTFIALLVATILFLIQRYAVIGYFMSSGEAITELMNNPFINMSMSERYATIFHTLGKYLQLLVWPHPLSHDYYPNAIPTKSWSDFTSILSLLIYIGFGVFGVLKFKKKNVFAYCILAFIATLSIVSNILFNVGAPMNERFIYMPSFAFALLVPYIFLGSNLKQKLSSIGVPTMSILAILFSILTIKRTPVWNDEKALNQSAIDAYPNTARSNLYMGIALFNEAQGIQNPVKEKSLYTESEKYIKRSLEEYPTYGDALDMKAGVAVEHFYLDSDINKLFAELTEVLYIQPGNQFILDFLEFIAKDGQAKPYVEEFYYKIGYVEFSQKMGEKNLAKEYLKLGYQLNPQNQKIKKALIETYDSLGDSMNANRLRTN